MSTIAWTALILFSVAVILCLGFVFMVWKDVVPYVKEHMAQQRADAAEEAMMRLHVLKRSLETRE